ncbi:hypothetical protein DL762_009574 [Monosporascus cannonballus]|uniref:Carrier domain-containing protein n=1 Tax=Monosporascus cannonballus TaxID=155416 RepID=A0ABY0GSZ5_9PEZI|nr:hypothetical protein DL762_009574 [Monosporascus cannonballus]
MVAASAVIFIETEVALISGIDLASQQITAAEQKVDYLRMSMGGIPMNGAESFDYLAANTNITFVHNFPGLVKSDNFRRVNPPEGLSLLHRIFLAAVKRFVALIRFFIGMTPNEAGEREAYHLTSDRYSPGAWRVHQNSEPVPATKALKHYEANGWPEKIWAFTMRTWDKALAKRQLVPLMARLDVEGLQFTDSYGPTEASCAATSRTIPLSDRAGLNRASIYGLVGSPIGNMRVSILGSNGQPLPVGFPGEIAIAGPGLAEGYIDRSQSTGNFVTDTFASADDTAQEVSITILQAAKGSLADAVVTAPGQPEFLVAHVAPSTGEPYKSSYCQPFARAVAQKFLTLLLRRSYGLCGRTYFGEAAGGSSIGHDTDFFMAGGSSLLLVRLQNVLRDRTGVSIPLQDFYRASTLRKMAALLGDERGRVSAQDIDWATEVEVPTHVLTTPEDLSLPKPRSHQRQVVLTGGTGFLGSEILRELLNDDSISKIHCIVVPADSRHKLPDSQPLINTLSSYVGFAETYPVPVRVICPSNSPVRLIHLPTRLHGRLPTSKGRFSRLSILQVGKCSVIGARAPHDDAMNSIIRFSKLSRTVPAIPNARGYFDFRDVSEIAAEIVQSSSERKDNAVSFRHHSSGVKVPFGEFAQRMEVLYGGTFRVISLQDWICRAEGLGIEKVIVSYLKANVVTAESLEFPYLGPP